MKLAKQRLREKVWDRMARLGVVRFPLPPHGRIPNFVGSERAALRVCELEVWQRAQVIKANPDSPQRPVRELALTQGKTVYMAVPRLRQRRCFVRLDPQKLPGLERAASTIRGAFRHGQLVTPSQMAAVDLIVVGCVAVNRQGAKLGKAGGYSDLEYALGREFGLVTEHTPVITTVHPVQVIKGPIPMEKHDVPIDYIITPDKIIRTERRYPKPEGIYWNLLDPKKLTHIPLLSELKKRKDRP